MRALLGPWHGVCAARQGRVVAHCSAMVSPLAHERLITGACRLLPGRAMRAVLFGG